MIRWSAVAMFAHQAIRRAFVRSFVIVCAVCTIGTATADDVLTYEVRILDRVTISRAAVRGENLVETANVRLPRECEQAIVAILPPGSQELRLPKSQIEQHLQRNLPARAKLILQGPDVVIVSRTANSAATTAASSLTKQAERLSPPPNVYEIAQVAATMPTTAASTATTAPVRTNGIPAETVGTAQSSTGEARDVVPLRVRKMIEQAIDRVLTDGQAPYKAAVVWAKAPAALARVTRIVDVRAKGALQAGSCEFIVDADALREKGSYPIEVQLTEVPTYLVAARPLRAGQIVTAADVARKPSDEASATNLLQDPQIVIGQQLRRAIPVGTWITTDLVSAPVVIRKQDLVEIRVQGGGVVIRTTAKALDEGSIGDLITVETMEPKRKLLARVAGTGVVEILTRPPQVGN